MVTLEEIERELTGPGGDFELAYEEVLGESLQVFVKRPRCLRELVTSSAAWGEDEFLVFPAERITFEHHERLVASVAAGLRARYGIKPGDRVAILAANCPEWIIAFFAVSSIGAIPVGMNAWWVADEIAFALGDCEPRLLVADRRRLDRLAEVALPCPVLSIEDDFPGLRSHDLNAPQPSIPIDEDDDACILYTSGTTGRPKGAVSSHRNIIALVTIQSFYSTRAVRLAEAHGIVVPPGANCALVTTPLFHVSGLFAGVVARLAMGGKTVWTRGKFDPVEVMELLVSENVTSWGPTPTMIHRVVHHPNVSDYDLSGLKYLGTGGAPASASLQQAMKTVFDGGKTLFGIGYGLTEGTALATLNAGEEWAANPESVGRPMPTVAVEIRDSNGHRLPDGEVGGIHIRGPLVMKRYWRRPDETDERIGDGRWLRTGDVGWMRDGRLFISSRRTDLIIRGGENVYPAEIENCLETHPDVLEAAAVPEPDEELGQVVRAIVVPNEQGLALDFDALRLFLAQHLAYFKVPAFWELRSEPLPRNASGKVMKHVLIGEAPSSFLED